MVSGLGGGGSVGGQEKVGDTGIMRWEEGGGGVVKGEESAWFRGGA